MISTLTAYLSRVANHAIITPGSAALLDAARKQARGEDGPPGERAVAAPLRAVHLSAGFANADLLERDSPEGIIRAAVLLFGHNVLARGLCALASLSSKS